jgi:hypothetical protein
MLHAPSSIQTSDSNVPVVLVILIVAAWNHWDRLFTVVHCGQFGEVTVWMISCADPGGRAV